MGMGCWYFNSVSVMANSLKGQPTTTCPPEHRHAGLISPLISVVQGRCPRSEEIE